MQPPYRGRSCPKISTMPRQRTEAAVHLQLYKLAIERRRLQQELHALEQRQQQIQRQMCLIEHQMAEVSGQSPVPPIRQPLNPPALTNLPPHMPPSDQFDTLFLEY